MNTVVKESVKNRKDITKAIKEASKSNAKEGLTSFGIWFKKMSNLLILL